MTDALPAVIVSVLGGLTDFFAMGAYMFETTARLTATALVVMSGAACSTNSAERANRETPAKQNAVTSYDETAIESHLQLNRNRIYLMQNGMPCEATAILTSAKMVDIYDESDQPIATNPEGEAGVLLGGRERPACLKFFTTGLSTFPGGQPVEPASKNPFKGQVLEPVGEDS